MQPHPKDFYDKSRETTYAHTFRFRSPPEHPWFSALSAFIERYELRNKRCLEIGSGSGLFQDLVEDYSGTDIADTLRPYYHKPYYVATGAKIPLESGQFDAIWTIATHEHIPDLQESLEEITRLLKPGGMLFFCPAWQCRSWAAEGYPVRPYSDFPLKGKLIKASIPIRDSTLWRAAFLFPKRFLRHLRFTLGARPTHIQYRALEPNWEHFWMSDSDACNHIDPHDAILWFENHGFTCESHPLHLHAFFVRTGALVFQKNRPR